MAERSSFVVAHDSPGADDALADDVAVAEAGVQALLRLMGEDPAREGLINTPRRFVQAFREIASRRDDPATDLAVQFEDVHGNGMPVAVGPIDFVSVCEHHLLPFAGRAWVAYVPVQGRVVGLSKLPRTVKHFAARPQLQERLTTQIARAVEEHLEPDGVAVLVRATHSCMTLRGVQTPRAEMTTYDLRGKLRLDPLRGEFFEAVVER